MLGLFIRGSRKRALSQVFGLLQTAFVCMQERRTTVWYLLILVDFGTCKETQMKTEFKVKEIC